MSRDLSKNKDLYAPVVSIITVTYNAESLIERTIKSVISLDYPSIEYIVIDGGSCDHTIEIVSRYREHIASLVSEPDNGIYDAMNKGLERATGDYVWFLNAGDSAASPDCLGELQRLTPPPTFLYSDAILVDGNGALTGCARSPVDLKRAHMELGSAVCHQCFVPRRELTARYDTKLRYTADQKWIVHILGQEFRGHKVSRPLAHYQLGGLSERHFLACLREKIRYSFAELGLPVALRVTLAAPYYILRFYTSALIRKMWRG